MCLRSLIPCILRPISFTYKFNRLPITFEKKIQSIKPCYLLLSATLKNGPKNDERFDASKAKLVSKLNFESAADALPFYKLPIKTLLHIYKVTVNDVNNGYCKNRLYYIAGRLMHPPSEVSELLAKRTFIYGLSFTWLESSLNVLLEMKVPHDRILRDLWVLKYNHITIRERLRRVQLTGCDKLYPWMVRCSEAILNRSIRISQDEKNILGENQSTQLYLANRLNTSIDVIEEMCVKMPALKTIRVTKVKTFLDYLISEGYKVEEIVSKPRVLSASQKTVKQRLEKLRKLGLDHVNLNVLCRSRKSFQKLCDTLESAS